MNKELAFRFLEEIVMDHIIRDEHAIGCIAKNIIILSTVSEFFNWMQLCVERGLYKNSYYYGSDEMMHLAIGKYRGMLEDQAMAEFSTSFASAE